MEAGRNSSDSVKSARLLIRSLSASAAEEPWHFGGFVIILLFSGTVILMVLLAVCCTWLHCLDSPATNYVPAPESETKTDTDKLELKEHASAVNSSVAD